MNASPQAQAPSGRYKLFFLRHPTLPGFGLSFGVSLLYLCLVILLPRSALLIYTSQMTWAQYWQAITDQRVLASYRVTLLSAFYSTVAVALIGLLLAWIISRYEFPGRRLLDSLIELPFALPTAVAGIALAALYAPNGWIGSLLAPLGIQVAYQPVGVVVALAFVGLPFVVRSVEPVLRDMAPEAEEAAATLGATRGQTFRRVVLPTLAPSLLTGFALAFARGAGEYGSVIFLAGNVPMLSEIAPLLIVARLEAYDDSGAAAVGLAMLAVSLAALLLLALAQRGLGRGRA